MEVDRARAVADVARVLVDSVKVEVDYIKATDAKGGSEFTGQIETVTLALPPAQSSQADIDRTSTGLVHRIKG